MIIYKCDRKSCGKEIRNSNHIQVIKFPCHIVDPINNGGYVAINPDNNKDVQIISGRMEEFHVCLECYNKIMNAAWEAFNKEKNK